MRAGEVIAKDAFVTESKPAPCIHGYRLQEPTRPRNTIISHLPRRLTPIAQSTRQCRQAPLSQPAPVPCAGRPTRSPLLRRHYRAEVRVTSHLASIQARAVLIQDVSQTLPSKLLHRRLPCSVGRRGLGRRRGVRFRHRVFDVPWPVVLMCWRWWLDGLLVLGEASLEVRGPHAFLVSQAGVSGLWSELVVVLYRHEEQNAADRRLAC